ncbi:MAG: ABC transporter ATP-binding protein, partial [Thermoplasmata archaeon]
MGDIVIKDLIKVYKTGISEVIALRGLDCAIKEGEILAIMGPSGCGKTTLLNIIGGLDRPTAGSVVVDGVSLVNLTSDGLVRHRREKVGIVFQFFNLVPTLTARENIELPMRLAGRDRSYRKTRTEELLKLVGMESRASHKPDEMSGGEQQRVGLAVALANDPPIILADEPTG